MHPVSVRPPLTEDHFSPSIARFVMRAMHAFCAVWFRFELRGAERVPTERCLWVGNHSAIGIVDVLTMLGAGHSHFAGRRVVGMMHDAFILFPGLGRLFRAFGAVRADRGAARRALAAGHDVLCYPGGNLDSCRPVNEAREVVFGSRRGYAKLALETGVKIVPVATIGSAYSYWLLPIGDWIARAVRLRRWTRDERIPFPVAGLGLIGALVLWGLGVLSMAWVAAALALLVIPNPARVTTEILEPIDVRGATAHIEDPEARLEAAHALVHGALGQAVRTLQH